MSEFLATAQVRVVPITTGFQAALRTQIKQAISTAGIFKIPITPELTKFRSAFKAELRQNPVSVPVIPDITGFRELLQARVKTASAGIAVTVPVVPGKVVPAEGGVKSGSASTKTLTKDTIQLTAAERGLAAQEAILGRISGQRAAAQAAINRSLLQSTTLQERNVLTTQALQSITNAEIAAENALATAIATKNTALAATLRLRIREIASDKASIADKAKEATLESTITAVRQKANIAISKSIILGTSAIALRKQDNALLALEAELESAAALARTTGTSTRVKEVAAIEAQILRRRELIATEISNIGSSKKLASQHAFAARGAGSAGLSFLGVRGATLAANSAFLAGAAAIAIFAKALSGAAKLETELNVFRLTAGATADEMERVRKVAIQLGADVTLPAVSAGDAASAFTNLAKAGLDVQDSIDGARGVLQLATAAQIENAEATELVASALNSFSLNGDEAVHVADLLTGAANAAQGSITDMGIALQQSSAVARQAGLSLEDTVAFITLLAKNGIRGSDAGTSLRTSLLRLIAPTEDASKQLKALNVTLIDAATGAIRPEVFAELAIALEGLGTTARNQVLRKIFGQDAIRAAVIFGREGTKGLNDVREATNQAGLAAELAGARTAGFAGKIEALKNSLATLGTNLGGIAIGPLSLLTDGINTLVEDVNGLVRSIERFNTLGDDQFSALGASFKRLDFTGLFSGGEQAIGRFSDGAQDLVDRMGLAAFQIGHVRNSFAQANDQAQILADTVKNEFDKETVTDLSAGVLELVNQLKDGDANAQALAARLQNVLRFIQEFGRKPTEVELIALLDAGTTERDMDALLKNLGRDPVKIQAALDENSKAFILSEFSVLGADAKVAWEASFGNIFDFATIEPPKNVNPFPPVGPQGILSPQQIANRLLGFDEEVTKAKISGAVNKELDALRNRRAFIESQLARKDISTAGSGPLLEARRKLQGELETTQSDIRGILDDQTSAAKSIADDLAEARTKADQAVIKAFAGAERGAGNAILIAESTEGVKDDIAANKTLRQILLKQVKAAGTKIKNLEDRRDFVQATRRRILQLFLEIEKDQATLATELAAAAEERREEVRESITLDIEFFNIRGNEKAEIRARQRLIANIQKEIDAIKKQKNLTQEKRNRLKELRNEQASERAAIKELQGEKEKSNDALQGLMFEFLQTQQGFASNLLGNLIPGFALKGLVGGGSAPTPVTSGSNIPGGLGGGDQGFFGIGGGPLLGLQAQTASRSSGPTYGQAATEVSVLQEMLRVLRAIASGRAHPEAGNQRSRQSANMDIISGGGGQAVS